MAKVYGHAAPLLQQIRSDITYEELANALGVATVSVHRRMHSPTLGLGPEKTIELAERLGATPAELKRVRVLDALDRGTLPIPDGATEQQVTKAIAALEGR